MTFTSSRAFRKQGPDKLLKTVIKSSNAKYWVPIDHPVVNGFGQLDLDGQVQANRELLQSINLDFWADLPENLEKAIKSTVSLNLSNFKPIPVSDWVSLIKLYSAFCVKAETNQELEVGGLIIVNRQDNQLRVVIPEQKVTKASVDWSILGKNITDRKKIFFLDGTPISYEELKADWDILGVTHSHNTMGAFPSGVDDRCEISDSKGKECPTGVHILVGSFSQFANYTNEEPNYEVYASISHLAQRQKIEDWSPLVASYSEEAWIKYTFSTSVLEAITIPRQTFFTRSTTFTPPKHTKPISFANPDNKKKIQKIKNKIEGLDQLYSRTRQNQKAADAVLVDAGYKALEDILDFLYYAMLEDAESISEQVRDYFSALGEILPEDLISTDPFYVADSIKP